MTITEFISVLERELPLSLAMADDPVGLQVMAKDKEVNTVGIAYELNESVIEDAIEKKVDLIIAFHPLIFPHVSSITGSNRVERSVISLIQHSIGLYILHTAFDSYKLGTNILLARALGCPNPEPLVPHSEIEGSGMGAIGKLEKPTTLNDLAQTVRTVCQTPVVRVTTFPGTNRDQEIRTIAVLGGSGMSFYDAAVNAKADVFITGDTRYHAHHAANDSIPIVDPGHAESEHFVLVGMTDLLTSVVAELSETIEVKVIDEPTNPIRYIF